MTGSVARIRAVVPTLAAIAAAALALVNLLSALTPNARWRGHLLLTVEPIGVMHVFHAVAVPASLALLVGAFYLRRRRRVAWHLAFALLCGLAMLDLVKGLDVEEAALSAAGAALLWWGSDAFTVHGDPVRLRSAAWRVPAIVAATFLVAIAAVAIAQPHVGLLAWTDEAASLLTWQPGQLRLGEKGEHLPLALGLLGLMALTSAAWLVFRPLAAPRSLRIPR